MMLIQIAVGTFDAMSQACAGRVGRVEHRSKPRQAPKQRDNIQGVLQVGHRACQIYHAGATMHMLQYVP